MPSTPSTRLRVELQALGENLSTWGDTRLNEALQRLDDAIGQVTTKAITGNVTLTSTNYVADEARAAALVLTGSPGATYKITIPGVTKLYLVANNTDASQTIGTSGGVAATIRSGLKSWVYCDATDTFVLDPTLDKIKAPVASVSMGTQKVTDVVDGVAAQDAATKAQIDAVYAYAAGIANSGILAPGTIAGQFLKWDGTVWAQSAIPPIVAGTGTTVSGSFTAGTMAVNADVGTGASKVVQRDANARIANLVGLWTSKTTTYTAVSGDQLIGDTSGGAFTITLPATPIVNDQVVIARIGASNLTIGRNGSTISGSAEDHVLDTNYALATVLCTASLTWRVIPGMLK